MPTHHDDQKKSINYYGVFSLWSSILLFASFFVLYTSGCEEISSLPVQCIMAVAFCFGIIFFLFSFCNIAIRLFHHKCLFYLIVLLLLVMSASVLYTSYETLGHQCNLGLYYERNYSQLKNVTTKMDVVAKTFESIYNRRNDHYTVSSVLDLIAAVFFAASAHAFRNRF